MKTLSKLLLFAEAITTSEPATLASSFKAVCFIYTKEKVAQQITGVNSPQPVPSVSHSLHPSMSAEALGFGTAHDSSRERDVDNWITQIRGH